MNHEKQQTLPLIRPRRPDRTRYFLALLSGVLLTGAFPNVGLHWLAWFALIPLFCAVNEATPWQGFRIGFAAGAAHFLSLTYWVAHTMHTYGHLPWLLSIPILLLLSGYLALYPALFCLFLTRWCRRPAAAFFLAPPAWAALEYVRAFLLTGFPWELLGYSQFENLQLVQVADITGPYGLSFLIVLGNSTIYVLYLRWADNGWFHRPISRQWAAGTALLFLAALAGTAGYGTWRIRITDAAAADAPSARVAVVQGNIPQEIKWKAGHRRASTQKYLDLSLAAREQNPELVVWPETATPFYYGHNRLLTGIVKRTVRKIGIPFLIGSPSFQREGETMIFYNSAYLVGAGGTMAGKYDKAHLVPFGEYVPLKRWLPFIDTLVEQVGDFRSGTPGRTLRMDDGTEVGVQICYEIIFPGLSRAMALGGAAFLANLTNDAWYGRSSAPYQHFSIAIFRAIENKRSLVRAANTGISGFVDPVGRILGHTNIFEPAVMTRPIPLMTDRTFYTVHGDLFARICLISTLVFPLITSYNRFRKPASAETESRI